MEKISVKIGSLTEQFRAVNIEPGTNVSSFLEAQGKEWSASVRVNAETVNKGYELKSGDVVTIVNSVSGGR
jgi:sulfur carrier protein ThiS